MPEPITPSNAVSALVNLSLDAVALCNEGANSRAHILFTKRKETTNMTFDELMAAMEPAQATLVKDHIASVVKEKADEIAKLNGDIATLTGTVTELQKAKPAEGTPDIFKGISPEAKAYIEKMQSTVDSLVAEREDSLAEARFAKVKALPVEEAALKSVLKSASPAMYEILEKAAHAVETALAAKGTDTGSQIPPETADSYYAQLEKAAKDIVAANAGMTFEKAFTQACTGNPDLYEKYAKGVRK